MSLSETKANTALPSVIEPESIIHPDIEAGAQHILEERLASSVRYGNICGIRLCLSGLQKAWEQAQEAAGTRFELTPEGKQVVPERIRNICAENISAGLGSVYNTTIYCIREGFDYVFTEKPEQVAALFELADSLHIPISYSPQQDEEDQTSSNLPATVISTRDQALAYLQVLIDRNLPQGIHGIVNMFGIYVSQGELKKLPEYQEQIERWIKIMQERGWTVVDSQNISNTNGEAQPGLLPRAVNRAEVRQLIDQAIFDNLAKGSSFICDKTGERIREGEVNPLEPLATQENIVLYIKTGERLGLARSNILVLFGRKALPERHFDPRAFRNQVKEAIKNNLPEGVRTIIIKHGKHIREADMTKIKESESALDQYVKLAKQYGVRIKPENIRSEMVENYNAVNLREGLIALEKHVRESLRTAEYLNVSYWSRQAEEYRQMVHQKGFGKQVDFSRLDDYLRQTATKVPELTSGETT